MNQSNNYDNFKLALDILSAPFPIVNKNLILKSSRVLMIHTLVILQKKSSRRQT